MRLQFIFRSPLPVCCQVARVLLVLLVALRFAFHRETAFDLCCCTRMNQGNLEFGASREMIPCTFFPIDDMPLFDVGGSNGNRSRKSIDMSSSSTVAFQHYANVEEDDLQSFLDNRSDMPPTRESSPEPVWHSAKTYEWKQEYLAERIQAHGQYLAPEPSVKPLRNNASHCGGGGLSLVSSWTDESVARASQARGGHLPITITSGSSPKNDKQLLMNFQ